MRLTLLGVLGVEVGRDETLGEWDMSWARLDTKTLVSLRESLALRIADGGLLAALSPMAPIPETNGDIPVARGELWRGELLALSLPRPVIKVTALACSFKCHIYATSTRFKLIHAVYSSFLLLCINEGKYEMQCTDSTL